MKKAILLNGPPQSGKDTIANFLEEKYSGIKHLKYAYSVKRKTHDYYGLNVSTNHFESVKDQPTREFGWKTPRAAYIDFSENISKPKYGNDVWIQHMLKDIKESDSETFVISDVGFPGEVSALTIHGIVTYLLYVHRPGHDFSKDSRNFVISGTAVISNSVYNTGTIADLQNNVDTLMKPFLGE